MRIRAETRMWDIRRAISSRIRDAVSLPAVGGYGAAGFEIPTAGFSIIHPMWWEITGTRLL